MQSIDRGSVVAAIVVSFPSEVPYGVAAEFALRALGSVEAEETAWLVGPGFEPTFGRVIEVRADVRPESGEQQA